MSREVAEFLVFMGILIFVISIVGYASAKELSQKYEEGYVQACKDFYQGKLKYQLVESNDGTRNWIKMENSK